MVSNHIHMMTVGEQSEVIDSRKRLNLELKQRQCQKREREVLVEELTSKVASLKAERLYTD